MHKYTPEQIKFLEQNITGRSRCELTEMFNTHFNLQLSITQITGVIKRYRLRSGYKKHTPKNRFFTSEMIEFLAENANGRNCHDLAVIFNEHFGSQLGYRQIRNVLGKHKIHNNHRTSKPIGSERINCDGYVYIKADNSRRWKTKQRVIWESINGPVPESHVVIFADGDKQNFASDNLLLISLRQSGLLHLEGLRGPTAELTRTGLAIADVMLKISDIKKQAGEKRHDRQA